MRTPAPSLPPVRRPGRRDVDAAMRLLCLPPAGGGASTFYPLLELDSPQVAICPISLPGREDRFAEAIPASMDALAERMAIELKPLLDRPYAILGYSMGGLLGWELATRWRDMGLAQPHMLFALAARPPHRGYADGELLHNMSSERFRDRLRKLGGLPPELLEYPEVIDIYEPIVRGDLRNCETYRHQRGAPLSCAIQAFVGDNDLLVSVQDAAGWRDHTSGPFDLHKLKAPHIFPRDTLLGIGRSVIKELNSLR